MYIYMKLLQWVTSFDGPSAFLATLLNCTSIVYCSLFYCYIENKLSLLLNCCLSHLSVCLFVRKVYCDKAAEWIRMLFGVESGVGRGMGILDGVIIVEGEEAVLGVNLGRLVVTNGDILS